MRSVTATTAEIIEADTQLRTLQGAGERFPVEFSLALATLQRQLRGHADAARALHLALVQEYGERDGDELRTAPQGGVLIARDRQAEFQAKEREVLDARQELSVPALRLEALPPHVQPTYALLAALLPFAAPPDGSAPSGAS